MRYRINNPTVIHETIDGETILVNLAVGTYYSLAQTGKEILDLLAAGTDVAAVAPALAERYAGSFDAIGSSIDLFVDELRREAIIVPDDAKGAAPIPGLAAVLRLAAPDRPAFEPPSLHKYEDMQELLLVDPIHEVDETGWPAPRPTADPER